MMLPSYALIAQGTQVHVEAWPYPRILSESHPAKGLLVSRAFALQGSCYVIAACSLLRPEDVPSSYRDFVGTKDADKSDRGSCIIAPGGEVIASAPANEEKNLTASVSYEAILQSKAVIDIGGHYSRPDVLQLHVDRRPIEPVVEIPVSGDGGGLQDP